MPSFPSQDLTNQYISESYQNVIQKYTPTGSTYYLLNGYGDVIFSLASSSFGGQLVTTNQTVTQSISASYATRTGTATFSDTASLAVEATFADTASLAATAISASYAPSSPSLSASYATSASLSATASYVIPSISSMLANANSTTVLFQYPNNINNSVFVKYMLNDSVNYRAGNVVVIYTTASIKLTETSTTDIGDTTSIVLNADISASTMRIFAVNNSNNDFNIKCQFDIL
jgi:hypothetical protein